MTFKEKQKQEAIKRLKMLKVMPNVIKDFEKNGRVYYSERQNKFFNAILYWLDNEEEYVKLVKAFEKKNNALVYHCQLTHTECGDLLSLLYVSADEDNWEYERQDIANGITYCYVANLDCEYDSDWGTIGIQPSQGGVLRTA